MNYVTSVAAVESIFKKYQNSSIQILKNNDQKKIINQFAKFTYDRKNINQTEIDEMLHLVKTMDSSSWGEFWKLVGCETNRPLILEVLKNAPHSLKLPKEVASFIVGNGILPLKDPGQKLALNAWRRTEIKDRSDVLNNLTAYYQAVTKNSPDYYVRTQYNSLKNFLSSQI